MKTPKTFSLLVGVAVVLGMGLIVVSAVMGSEFLRRLGLFPILFALFVLPHALLEWEASGVVHVGASPTDKVVRLDPSATAAGVVTGVRS